MSGVLGVKVRHWESAVWGTYRIFDIVNFVTCGSEAKVLPHKKLCTKPDANQRSLLTKCTRITVFEKYLLRDCDRDLRTPKDVAYKRRAMNPARGYLLHPHF